MTVVSQTVKKLSHVDILKKLGLTDREAQIYQELLRLGETPVAGLLKATGAHPQVIYRALDGLEAKRLVTSFTRRGRKHVKAESPQKLVAYQKSNLSALESALPDLLKLQKPGDESIVRVARGNEAVRTMRVRGAQELPTGGTYYIIGATGTRYYEVMGDAFYTFERIRAKKKIKMKMIAFVSQKPIIERKAIKTLLSRRYLPETFPAPTSTNIFNDTVAIVIWSDDPIVITIESAPIAESYRHYFSSLWKVAKP